VSDDAHFRLLRYVSGQNCLCWRQEISSEMHESPLLPSTVTVQRGEISSTVIGPQTVENEKSETQTVNT